MSIFGDEAGVEHNVYRMLTKTFLLLDDYERQFFANYDLSARQFWALQHLDEQRGCSMIDLSRLLLTDKSSVTSIIDRLERLNLVTRTQDSHDRRIILITLTPEGRRLRDMLHEQHTLHIHQLMSVVHSPHLHLLLDCLYTISSSIETNLEQPRTSSDTQIV